MKESNIQEKRNLVGIYYDALKDIFGNFCLKTIDESNMTIVSESGDTYKCLPNSQEKGGLVISRKSRFQYDGFWFSITENKIYVTEIKVDLHKCGANVEIILRDYGKSRYDKNHNALLDLQSTNYVVKNYSDVNQLFDEDFLKTNSLLITAFSAHMKYFYKVQGEAREFVTSIYPSHVYFNGEDISIVYECVDGIDKISKIYGLYSGNISRTYDNNDIDTIINGIAGEGCYDYRQKHIGEQIRSLIDEKLDVDIQEQMVEELIEKRTGKPNPVIIGLRDATRVEVGITPTQSRKRLENKIDEIVGDKPFMKIKRAFEKLKQNSSK